MVGSLEIYENQAEQLQLKPYSRLSGGLEKACLRLSANESFLDAEQDIEALSGIAVGHSTQQRLVVRQDFELPETTQGISELSIDAGWFHTRKEKTLSS